MKKYKIILLGYGTTVYINGWLSVYSDYYLIIDEHQENNYFPKLRSVILTRTE